MISAYISLQPTKLCRNILRYEISELVDCSHSSFWIFWPGS